MPGCQEITITNWTNPREYSGKVYNATGGTENLVPTDGGTQLQVPTNGGGTSQGTKKTLSKPSTPTSNSHITSHILEEEDTINTEPFGLLMDAFINESNIPAFGITPRDVEAGQRMVQAGVTEADVIAAVKVLQDKGYNMVGLASVERTTYNEAGKRKNKGDKDRSSDKARSKYAEGWK